MHRIASILSTLCTRQRCSDVFGIWDCVLTHEVSHMLPLMVYKQAIWCCIIYWLGWLLAACTMGADQEFASWGMVTSWQGYAFCISGPLWGGFPSQKAINAQVMYFLCCWYEQDVEQKVDLYHFHTTDLTWGERSGGFSLVQTTVNRTMNKVVTTKNCTDRPRLLQITWR